MVRCFELAPEQIKIKNILTNKPFLEIEIYPMSNEDPNRNDTCFTLASMQKGLPEFIDKPIVGFFNRDDFEGHKAKTSYDHELEQEYWDNDKGEQILGFMRQSDSREIVEKDGLSWIRCSAMIYTQYNYKQVKKLLKDKRKKVSVEVVVKKSEVTNGIEYIYEFELLGITILGSKYGRPILEAIPGAHLSVLDVMDEIVYSNQRKALAFAYKGLNINEKEVNDLIDEKTTTVEEVEGQVASYEDVAQNAENVENLDTEVDDEADEVVAEGVENTPTVSEEAQSEEGGKEPNSEPDVSATAASVEMQERYESLQAQCSTYEEEISAYKETCERQEKEIAAYAAKAEEVKDYEAIKSALELANTKLMSIQIAEQKAHIVSLMSARGLTEDEVKEVREKCDRREFSDLVGIDKEVAYIIYQKEQHKVETKPAAQYSVNITEVALPSPSTRKDKTVAERLRENIKK